MPLPFSKGGIIEWQPAYNLNISSIDKQHRMLVSIIQQLQEAMLEARVGEIVGPLFKAMNQYTKFHFQYEEQLLEKHGYADLEPHRKQHAALVRELQQLEKKYGSGELSAGAPVMQFLRTWLLDHIGEHDKAYASFLREKGVS
jgi:hemerythrin-like metal-binding protein